jgi:pentatricopeptide repeat protein
MFSKLQQPTEAVSTFKQMIINGIKPNATAYNAMIDMFAKFKLEYDAQHWFQRMRAASVCNIIYLSKVTTIKFEILNNSYHPSHFNFLILTFSF